MPDVPGRDLVREWRKAMDAMASAAGSVAGRSEVPAKLLEPMQRQLELVQEIVERERRMQKQVAGRLFAPVDAVLDLLEESGAMMRQQAEALESAGRALEEGAGIVKAQAVLFERVVGLMRQPAELAKVAAGAERRSSKRPGRQAKR